MAISVKGKLAEKVSELLGGRNITEKRVESLLAELEESRAALAAYKAIHEPTVPTLTDRAMKAIGPEEAGKLFEKVQGAKPGELVMLPPGVRPNDLTGLAVPILTAGLTEGELADVEDDPEDAEPSPEDPAVLARHLEVQPLVVAKDATSFTVETGIPAPPSPTLSPEMQAMQAMMEMVQVLKAEVQALKAPATEKDKKEAIADGKLPAVVATAGPTGYTGSAQLPRGKWFQSPLGPNINMRLCDCKQCTPFRIHHYFCVICRRGPLAYAGQTGPKGRKQYTAPGSTWGVVHECCSVTCYMRYLEAIGVAPGINDAEPPMANPTEQPMVALGSD